MAVKLRSVHTGKFYFVPHSQTAGAAHAGSVHHDRIHADDGVDPQFFCQQTDKFHHNHRSDGNHQIVFLFLILHQILDHIGYHAFSLIGTVVCCHVKIADFFHLLFQDHQVFVFRAHDGVCFDSMLAEPFYLGIYGGSSHTAGHKEDLFLLQFFRIFFDQFRRPSQRADEICEGISGLQTSHL